MKHRNQIQFLEIVLPHPGLVDEFPMNFDTFILLKKLISLFGLICFKLLSTFYM